MGELRFDGRVALVTGAGRGLGRGYARLLASRGCSVVVNDAGVATNGLGVPDAPADEVVKEITGDGGVAVVDGHSVIDAADAIVEHAVDEYGRLDIVINNAGISGGGRFTDIPKDDFDRMINTHFGGTVSVSRAAWPHLVAAGHGRIVNTSSGSVFGSPGTSAYISAKAALIGFTRALAAEGPPVGITVNAIMPAAFTRLTAQIPDGSFRDFLASRFPPEAVAPFVVWLTHIDTTINGELFSVGGGRAARVFLGEAPGVTVSEATPDAWVGHQEDLLSIEGHGVPPTMMDEVYWMAQHLGLGAGDAELTDVDPANWAAARNR
jgi:NAD(P)-dependent dehydrogenase (short-subunit alcohol dehydrogenase family)